MRKIFVTKEMAYFIAMLDRLGAKYEIIENDNEYAIIMRQQRNENIDIWGIGTASFAFNKADEKLNYIYISE